METKREKFGTRFLKKKKYLFDIISSQQTYKLINKRNFPHTANNKVQKVLIRTQKLSKLFGKMEKDKCKKMRRICPTGLERVY